YLVDLSAFGDLSTRASFTPDLELADALQRRARKQGLRVRLCTETHLDHGTAVPLLMLYAEGTKAPNILPISYSGLSPDEHHRFALALQEILAQSHKRVAVIASGDLSHALSSDAPEGLRPEGKLFDATAVSALRRMDAQKLLAMDPAVVDAASECGYRPLLMLLGALDGIHVKPRVLSYEAPFGVGYLTAEFILG
ncbi:MAG: AmmeMemoRadiSam system protein B, partial [Anaerolineales bacterium]|nr:AmmeMemoRadiSam system protein B [Anaerolineales bacterium]